MEFSSLAAGSELPLEIKVLSCPELEYWLRKSTGQQGFLNILLPGKDVGHLLVEEVGMCLLVHKW